MTDLTDEYREKADQCRQMADRVASPSDREMWLQLSDDWSVMASLHERFRWPEQQPADPATSNRSEHNRPLLIGAKGGAA